MSTHRDQYIDIYNANLASAVVNCASATSGPHSGSKPLQRVFAFCNKADSHSSLDRACLIADV